MFWVKPCQRLDSNVYFSNQTLHNDQHFLFVFVLFTLVSHIVSQLFITCLRRNANTSARDLWCSLKNCWNCFSYLAVRQRCKGSHFFHSIIHFLLVLTRCSQRMGHSISCVGIPLPKNTGTIFVSVGNYFMMACQ